MTTLHLRKSIGRSPLRRGYLLIPLALCCFALLQTARAVMPPPDGGYPNDNTAEGDSSLLNLTTGTDNTAIGFQALQNNATGIHNTATGVNALIFNTMGSYNIATGSGALLSNTTGIHNTANGYVALL